MNSRIRSVAGGLGFLLLAAAATSTVEAGARQGVPHGGGAGPHTAGPGHAGGGPRMAAPSHTGGSGARTAAPRGYATPRGTANGIARYGYGYGYPNYGYGYGGWYGCSYPWWGWGWGWDSGWGWYGGWGWPGYGYAAYGPPYAAYDSTYVVGAEGPPPSGPATVETAVSPSKAEVLLDGELVGFAGDYSGRWDQLSVAPGHHTITFREAGYRTLVVTFEAHPRATYVFKDALVRGEGEDSRTLAPEVSAAAHESPAPDPTPLSPMAPSATGRLRVHAEPADAAVYLDGEYLGLGVELARIHASLAVATGGHRVEAVHPGYVSAARAIEVGGTDTTVVELILEREH